MASRHLQLFGHSCTLLYPKETTNVHYLDLLTQAEKCKVARISELPEDIAANYDLVVDAVFGFSFQAQGAIREPFGGIIDKLSTS